MLACCHIMMCKAAGRHYWQHIITEQSGLRRRTIPQHGGAIGMCAFISPAMLPAHNQMTIKRNTVRDQEAVERSPVDIRAGWIIDTARQAAQGKRNLLSPVPVVPTQAPLFGTGDRDLRRLAIIQVDMWIALKRAIRHGEVDHGANQLATALDIQKGHILSRSRLDHTVIGSVKRSPPLLRIRERLIAHTPTNTIEGRIGQNSDASARGKRHRPVEMNVHRPCLILTHSSNPTLHQLAIPGKIDTCSTSRQEFDRRIDTWMRFTIPIDQQARVAKTYHFLCRHLKLQRADLSGTIERYHRCFPLSRKCKIALLLRDRLRRNITSSAAQKANHIVHRLLAVPGTKRAPIGQFTIERVEVAVDMLRCLLHALLKWNGCGHNTATLALLRIQGKRGGEGACRTTDRVRLSKSTCVHRSPETSIPHQIPAPARVLSHTHKCHDARSQLIKENMLTIWQDTHHVRIISVAATRISGRCALNPISQFQIRKFIQVAIGVKAEIERRGRLRTCGGCYWTPRLPLRPHSYH